MPVSLINPLFATSRSARSSVRSILRAIRLNHLDLALWERKLPAPVSALCRNLAAQRSRMALDVTAALGPPLFSRLIGERLFQGAAHIPALHWLLEDLCELAADFADVADCPTVRIRLTKVAGGGCAAFHVDTLPVRLLCTYVGAGTQWVDEPHLRRSELGLRDRDTGAANAAIVPDPAHIHTMPAAAVAIFKGCLWPGAGSRGLVHRSHPVCCGDHARLRLVIDPVGGGS